MFPGGVGVPEMIVVGIIALLLFGKRLPEVARSLGKGIVEFKKGVSGVEDDVRSVGRTSSSPSSTRPVVEDDQPQTTAPKFDPPTSAPQEAARSEEARA